MRRRQIADAPATPTALDADTTPSAEITVSTEPTPIETASESEPETPKRRRTPRRKADVPPVEPEPVVESLIAEPEPTTISPAATEASVEAGDEPAKPKRAPRRRKTATAEESAQESPADLPTAVPATELAEVTADPVVIPVEEAPPVIVSEVLDAIMETDPAPETKARRPRRARKSADTVPDAVSADAPTIPVSVPTAALEAAEDAVKGVAPAPPTQDAPRRTGRRTVPVSGLVQTAPAPVQSVTPAARQRAEPVPVLARTRGLRRGIPAATPPLPPAPVYVPPADARAEPTSVTPVRVRGLRRAPRPAVVQSPTATPALLVPTKATAPPIPVGYQPLPLDKLARLAETKVSLRHGYPELNINGKAELPFWFFVNTEDPDARDLAVQEIRLAYEAGVRFFSVLAHLPWKKANGERRHEPLDDALRLVRENAPDGFILPRLIFSPPASWVRAHPDDMTRYADGDDGDISLGSRTFWEQDAPDALRAAIEQIAQGEYASCVFGIYLEHGEWFYERGRGFDVSPVSTDAFRGWLRTHYKGSLVALRAAWHDGTVTFDSVPVPQAPPADNGLFFVARQQRYADYNQFSSDLVAQVINRLGKAVKEASANRLAVAVSYGYTLELPRAGSGHLALAQILSAPHIDILTGPLSYSSRTAGGSAPLPAPVDSIHLAGKLWVSEDDTKTYLAAEGDDTNPRIEREETFAVQSRNFGAALSHGAGISYMDLWGQGWFADRAIWEGIGSLKRIGEQVASLRRDQTMPTLGPDVAVIVDEASFFGVRADEELLSSLVSDQRDALTRSGARIGYYLMSDLAHPNFPASARLLLFLNAFALPESMRSVLREKFQSDGRTLAFLYGTGVREDNLSELADALGIQLRLQPWGSKVGTQILSGLRSPLTDGVQGQRIGDEERINPSLYVSDPKAQVVGEYIATGNPSIAVRRHTRWQSVFIGERGLSLPLLRGLYRLAGVPIYTADDDVAWVGDQILCLHSAPGGGTTLYLPEDAGIADLLTGEVLASNGYGARLAMPPRGTRLLLIGGRETASRFGIDLNLGQPGLTEDERPALQLPFAVELAASPPRSGKATTDVFLPPVSTVSAEDEALFAAALAGEISLDAKENGVLADDVPLEAESAADSAENAARRKRRRRRGRGRADEEVTDETTDAGKNTAEAKAEPEPFLPALDAPRQPGRPSLDELLPLSDEPADGELPPIPHELLPLDGAALNGPDDAPEMEAAPRRARRGRARRGRAAEADAMEVAEAAATEGGVAEPVESGVNLEADTADVEAVEPAGMSELTSVGLEPNADPEPTPSGIASPLPNPDEDDSPEAVEDAAEALGAAPSLTDDAGADFAPVEMEVAAAAPETTAPEDADEAARNDGSPPASEEGEPVPVERPDVSSGEANPS